LILIDLDCNVINGRQQKALARNAKAFKESGSFLKKRTKKLLLLGRTLPDRSVTAT
jgi:hypothetical protein